MITENELLEPKKLYKEKLESAINKNANEYFDKLTKESGVDIEANARTMEAYRKANDEVQNASKKLKSKQSLKGFVIFSIVFLFLVGIILCVFGGQNIEAAWYFMVIGILLIAGAISLIVVLVKNINKTINNFKAIVARAKQEVENLKSEGYMQLEALNSLFDWNMHTKLFEATIPLIKMDKFFDMEKYEYLIDKFNYHRSLDDDESTVHVLSGSILGNPFVVETNKVKTIGQCTYHGSLTYSYSVTVKTKDGWRTERRTDTLHASINKPKPYYNYEKWIYYGNEAAPKLVFSREPVIKPGTSEADIKKYVDKETKKLDKYTEKHIDKGFTPLGNNEFETLFHVWERNDEVQFRLLFTPLAQRNMVDLIKDNEFYGDDFYLRKDKMLNKVQTRHSLTTDYVCHPEEFIDFDYENSKRKFVEYNAKFFKSFYFDLAPLMSIPLYHQLPTDEYIFQHKFRSNVAPMEAESIVNQFARSVFEPEDNKTELILKTQYLMSSGTSDRVNVRAYGHTTIDHVEYVPMMGKDGHLHSVPVPWVEYIPCHNDTAVEVVRRDISRKDYRARRKNDNFKAFLNNYTPNGEMVCHNGLFSYVVSDNRNSFSDEQFDSILK